MPRKKGFYSQTPAVSKKVMAGENPIAGPELGAMTPPTVPQRHEGATHAFGPQIHQVRPPSVKGAHGWGHLPHEKKGHLRMSGSSKAHQVGRK